MIKKNVFLLFATFLLVQTLYSQPLTETAKVLPVPYFSSETLQFGSSVSISGSYAVVGVPGYNQSQGYVNVLHYTGTEWQVIAVLIASDAATGDSFGCSVSISGDYIVVGASGDDDNGDASGSAYVFEKPLTGWADINQIAKLTASDGSIYDNFGISVSISDSSIVVGAYKAEDDNIKSGLSYVFEKPISGWTDMTQTAKLRPSDGIDSDYFGYSVSISGNCVVVGAYGKDDFGLYSGAAYVFEKPLSGWIDTTQSAKFFPSDSTLFFGNSVDILGDDIVVGSAGDDDNGSFSGAAYIFEKPVSGWKDAIQTIKLKPSDGVQSDFFGSKVSISDSCVIVGSLYNNNNGSAYIFKKNVEGWTDSLQVAKLIASDGEQSDYFSSSVCISGDNILIGAAGDDENGGESGSVYTFSKPTTGWIDTIENQKILSIPYLNNINNYYGNSVAISGDYAVVGAPGYNQYQGYADVLYFTGTEWQTVAKLTASDGIKGDYFGNSVDISADYIVIGAYKNGDTIQARGAVYVFEKPYSGWTDTTQTAKLISSDGDSDDYFGYSVSISNDYIVVGAYGDDDNGPESGSAYVFKKSLSGWIDTTQIAKLIPVDGDSSYNFGYSVAIDSSCIVVGAYHDAENGIESGSVYVFERPLLEWTDTTQTAKLTASDAYSYKQLGNAVDINGDIIIAGAIGDNYNSLGGSAYIYEKPISGWTDTTQTAKLFSSDADVFDCFGSSVSILGDYILVGAYNDDDNGQESGAAYFFQKSDSVWVDTFQTLKITPHDGTSFDNFGTSVCITNQYGIVGAENDDDNGSESGSVYMLGAPTAIEIINEPLDQFDVCGEMQISYNSTADHVNNYQWQESSDGGVSFINLLEEYPYSGVQTRSLNITTSVTQNNNQYRCMYSNPLYSDTSNTVILTLESELPEILCVGNQSIGIPEGQNYYLVQGTELDPVFTNDNCGVKSVVNNYNNNSSLEGEVFTKETTTSIAWTVTDVSGNTDTCSFDVFINEVINVDNISSNNISIFPNPTSENLTINISKFKKTGSVEISDISGKKIIQTLINNHKLNIDLSSYARGIYFIKIRIDNEIIIKKIVKK